MILVEARGGLGNQLFQYAFARYVQLETSDSVSMYWGQGEMDTWRNFSLVQFTIQLPNMPVKQARHFIRSRRSKWMRIFFPSSVIHVVQERPMLPVTEQLLRGKKNVVYRGDWFSVAMVNHVRALLLKDLEFIVSPGSKSQALAARIKNTRNATVLHIRSGYGGQELNDRGEKVSVKSVLRPLSTDYYARAIYQIERKLNKPTLFVFADDIEEAASLVTSIPTHSEFVYVDSIDRPNWEDLYLMQQGQHFILSNSTFAWWACWLSQAKRPSKTSISIMPKNWLGYSPGEVLSQRLKTADDTVMSSL